MDNSSDSISGVQSNSSSEDNDTLDPRIQVELERLNHANEAINHLELQLDEARKTLQELWNTSQIDLARLEKSIGVAVSKAQSYYDTRIKLRDSKDLLTKAKHRFERAQALHVAAKELALVSVDYIDEAKGAGSNAASWSETYRHAVTQAGDAEREKYLADVDQQRAERVFFELEKVLEKLQKDFGRSINKSQPYYQAKAEFHKELEFQKRKVCGLENCVNEAKSQYQESLKNLERISNEIHAQRKQGTTSEDSTSDILEEDPIKPILPKPTTPTAAVVTSPMVPEQIHRSDSALRSCLLRTESLPVGIITNTTFRPPPKVDEGNHQFILRPKELPPIQSTVPIASEQDAEDSRNRLASISSQKSQPTDDDDDRNSILNVLSDEQLDHLAYGYHPYPSDISYSTDAFDELLMHLENSTIQAKSFFRKLFKTDTITD